MPIDRKMDHLAKEQRFVYRIQQKQMPAKVADLVPIVIIRFISDEELLVCYSCTAIQIRLAEKIKYSKRV